MNINQTSLNEKIIEFSESLLKKYNDLKQQILLVKDSDSIESLNKKIINLEPITIPLKKYQKSLLVLETY